MGTTTTTANPWSPIQPYLVGGVTNADGTKTPGVADQAAQIYGANQGAMPGYLQNAYNNQINLGLGYGNSQGSQMINQNAQNILSGSGAAQFSPVANAENVVRDGRGAIQADAAQGKFDLSNLGMGGAPQDAYTRMLSGKADTSTLDPVVNNATRRLTDNFNEQVMPSLRQGANMNGQLGSSRQGIAEGLAAKGLSQSIGDMTGNMYNSAYNNAQGLMQGAAGQLGGFSTSLANNNAAMQTQVNAANAAATNQNRQFNVQRIEDMNKFNANLGISNNNQAMQNYNNNISAFNTAAGALNANANTASNLGLTATNAANNANNYGWGQLTQYQNAVQPLAGLGSTQQTPYYSNPLATGVGAAVGAAKVWDAVSNTWKTP